MSLLPSSGLYAVTGDHGDDPDAFLSSVGSVLRGGAVMLQYRAKGARASDAVAQELRLLCRARGVPLIINDDVERAFRVGADGVHLGRHDAPVREARQRLGPQAIIGVSCYDSVACAMEAAAEGASYVAFGRFFPSKTKPDAPLASFATLERARAKLKIPRVAIGGITPENGLDLIGRGADLLAVIEGLFGADHPEETARRFQRLWTLETQSQLNAPPV